MVFWRARALFNAARRIVRPSCSSATWPRRLSNEATAISSTDRTHGDAWVPRYTCHRFLRVHRAPCKCFASRVLLAAETLTCRTISCKFERFVSLHLILVFLFFFCFFVFQTLSALSFVEICRKLKGNHKVNHRVGWCWLRLEEILWEDRKIVRLW